MTTSIKRDDLVKFLESTGHEPRIERVSGRAPAAPDPIAFGAPDDPFNPAWNRDLGPQWPERRGTMLQNGGAMTAAAERGQGHDHAGLHEGRDRGIQAPAGAGGFLGALVRALQAAHADPGKGGEGGQGQGQARQDEHRRASGHPRPDGHPVDPGGDRLRQRPAGRRLHGRAAGKPGGRLPRAAHQGQDRRRGTGSAEGGRCGAGRRQCRRRGRHLCAGAGSRTAAMCPRSPGWRAATSRPAISSRPRRRSPWCRKPSATKRRSPPRAPRSKLAEQAKSVGPVDELEQKVAANPLDHQARFDLAAALNAKGKRAEAVDHLLEIVKRDRKWNEDGARKQLVQFFEAWGSDRSGRRRRPQAAVVDFVFVMSCA